MTGENTDISIEITCECGDIEVDFSRLKRLAGKVCRRFQVNKAQVSIAIVNDEVITRINREFLDEGHETDVISFDLSDEMEGGMSMELVVNADEARRQAENRGHGIEAELALYIAHGLLHNFGFDDRQAQESRRMHEMEDEILEENGYGAVYGGSGADGGRIVE